MFFLLYIYFDLLFTFAISGLKKFRNLHNKGKLRNTFWQIVLIVIRMNFPLRQGDTLCQGGSSPAAISPDLRADIIGKFCYFWPLARPLLIRVFAGVFLNRWFHLLCHLDVPTSSHLRSMRQFIFQRITILHISHRTA